MNKAIELLVDDHHGVYSYHVLAQQHPLYVNDGPLTGYKYIDLATWLSRRADMDGETLETVFHPDNEEWSENVEYLEYHNILAVEGDNGEYWQVMSLDGGIFAINPKVEWDYEKEEYYIPGEEA